MIRLAVAALLACSLLLPSAADGKRVGLIRIFAVTKIERRLAEHVMVVKIVRAAKPGTKALGEITQVCTDVDVRQVCSGTLQMPLGRIMFGGTRRSARYYVFAVVGGTGLYSGSTGTYAASTISTGPRTEYLLISLVP